MSMLGVTSCINCRLSVRYELEEGETTEWVACPICGVSRSVNANATVKPHTDVGIRNRNKRLGIEDA